MLAWIVAFLVCSEASLVRTFRQKHETRVIHAASRADTGLWEGATWSPTQAGDRPGRCGQAPPAPGGTGVPLSPLNRPPSPPTVGPASLGVATTTLRPNVRLVMEPRSAAAVCGEPLGRSWHRGHWNHPLQGSWSSRVVHPESPGHSFRIPLPPTSPSHGVSEMPCAGGSCRPREGPSGTVLSPSAAWWFFNGVEFCPGLSLHIKMYFKLLQQT